MEKTIRTLKILYFAPLLVSLALVVCYETGLFAAGTLCFRSSYEELIVLTLLELVSIGVIPLALWLWKPPRQQRHAAPHPEEGTPRPATRSLRRRGTWSIALIALPMVADTLAYYLFLSVPCGYLAIILLLSSIFVYPSAARCQRLLPTSTTDE